MNEKTRKMWRYNNFDSKLLFKIILIKYNLTCQKYQEAWTASHSEVHGLSDLENHFWKKPYFQMGHWATVVSGHGGKIFSKCHEHNVYY